MKTRWLALGLAVASCLAPAQAQQKMPVPVEDDPNAPPELRGQKTEQTPPAETPAPPEAAASASPYSQAMVAYKAGDYDRAFDALKGIDPATQDDNFVTLEAHILSELKRYDEGEKLLRKRLEEEVHAAPAQKAQTQQKMPLPVEDDPNAPAEMRGQKPSPAPTAPSAPAPPEASSPSGPYSQAMAAYKEGEYADAYNAIKGIDPTSQDDNFLVLDARILTEL